MVVGTPETCYTTRCLWPSPRASPVEKVRGGTTEAPGDSFNSRSVTGRWSLPRANTLIVAQIVPHVKHNRHQIWQHKHYP